MPDTAARGLTVLEPAPQPERSPPGSPPFPDMVWVPGGTYRMGSDHHYPEEAPTHRVTVDGFWMDRYPVTNEAFARFVEQTRHVTFAEIPPSPDRFDGTSPVDAFPPNGHGLSDMIGNVWDVLMACFQR